MAEPLLWRGLSSDKSAMRSLSRILVAMGVLLGFAGAADASPILAGQTIQMTYRFPTINDVISTTTSVVGPAIEWSNFIGEVSVDASDTNIRFQFLSTSSWAPATFSGFGFFNVNGTIPGFAGVTLNSTNMAGFVQSNISFDADHIYVNWQGLSYTPATFVSIDIAAAAELPSTVPEPATLTLLGVGLVVAAGLARSRRR